MNLTTLRVRKLAGLLIFLKKHAAKSQNKFTGSSETQLKKIADTHQVWRLVTWNSGFNFSSRSEFHEKW